MIKFTLACDNGHQFESWFASSAAYDSLIAAGMVSCVNCGSLSIDKSLMSPSVSTSPSASELTAPATEKDIALSEMRRKVEDTADYVGLSFATEARAMHDGSAPERPIYGEANLRDAKSLIEDGVPVMPLPFIPKRKTN